MGGQKWCGVKRITLPALLRGDCWDMWARTETGRAVRRQFSVLDRGSEKCSDSTFISNRKLIRMGCWTAYDMKERGVRGQI